MRRRLGIAWVAEAIIGEMVAEAEHRSPCETGGVLLGYWAREFEEVVITRATGPGPAAIHRKDEFIPDARFHREEVSTLYTKSGRTETYLGDWHSHPGGLPALSRRDRRTLAAIAAEPAARAPVPVMAVVAGRASLTVTVYRYERRRWAFLGPPAIPLALRIHSGTGCEMPWRAASLSRTRQ